MSARLVGRALIGACLVCATASNVRGAPGVVTLGTHQDGALQRSDVMEWMVHEGDLPSLHGVHADTLDMALLDAAFTLPSSTAAGWAPVSLPYQCNLAALRARQPDADPTWWMTTRFSVPASLKGRSVALWFGVHDGIYRVYVNGDLVGAGGRMAPNQWTRSPLPPVALLPPSLLYTDRPNTIAMMVHSPHINTVLSDVFLNDFEAIPAYFATGLDLGRMFSIGITFLILAAAGCFFAWYLRQPEETEYLYATLGTLGFVGIFIWGWVMWLPFGGVVATVSSIAGVGLANFMPLYFQIRYDIHRHRAWPYAVAANAALFVGIALCLDSVYDKMTVLMFAAVPVSGVAFLYGIYLNVRAFRAHNQEARRVIVGYGLFTLFVALDAFSVVRIRTSTSLVGAGFGVVAFFGSVIASLAARFWTLYAASQSLSDRLRRQQDDQDFIIGRIGETASEIEIASGHILASAGRQQIGATEQASAVQETRRTMDALLSSGQSITITATDVLRHAELTQKHNLAVAKHISESSVHSRRITEILDIIRDVANKSELLALNAALEGSRAGEAGRGFALVATEMQRLAEGVMSAVADIKLLTSDIRTASSATEASTRQATELSSATTLSAQQIGLIIKEQQQGTEQVSHAMDDVADIAQQTAQSGKTTLERTQALMRMADQLRALVEGFRGSEPSRNPSDS